jgi:hypothetical protein
MADTLLNKQEPAGHWNENLADLNHCGGPESIGIAWGINW